MQGRVFSLVRQGQHQGLSHPNAVILQTAEDSFLCVAGFSPGKHAVEQFRFLESQAGVHADAFGVLIDHRVDLTPVRPGLTLHECIYVSQTAEKISASQLHAGVEWGTLSDAAVASIVEAVLQREAISPYLPQRSVKLLRKWLDSRGSAPPP